jgi:hypothetical protein
MDSFAQSFTTEQINIFKNLLVISPPPPTVFTFDESWNTPSTPYNDDEEISIKSRSSISMKSSVQ